MKLTERNDTGGNKLTRQVNKRLMHSNTIKIVLILLQTKHATKHFTPFKYDAENMFCFFFKSWEHHFLKKKGLELISPFNFV